MKDKIFYRIILVSCGLHLLFCLRIPFFFSPMVADLLPTKSKMIYTNPNKSLSVQFKNNKGELSTDKRKQIEHEIAQEEYSQQNMKNFVKIHKHKNIIPDSRELLRKKGLDVYKKINAPVMIKDLDEEFDNPQLIAYRQHIMKMLKEKAFCYYQNKKNKGKVQIELVVNKTGTIQKVFLIRENSSENSYLHTISLKSAYDLNPLPRLPRSYQNDDVKLKFVIIYHPKGVKSGQS